LDRREGGKVMARPNGYVSETLKKDAIAYLFESGFLNEMTSDKKFYTTVLLAQVANDMNIELVGLDLEHGGIKDDSSV